jgi:hypothetical protein
MTETQTKLKNEINIINDKRIKVSKEFKHIKSQPNKTPKDWDKFVELREQKEESEKNLVVKENDLFLMKMQDKKLKNKLK